MPIQTQEETPAEGFEDVDIADKPAPQQHKKRGLFSRITDSGDHAERPTSADGKSGWRSFAGRKRGQSGQGSELGSIPKRETTPKPESQLRKEQHPSPAQLKQQQSSVDDKAQAPAQLQQAQDETPKAVKTVQLEQMKQAEPEQAQAGAEASAVEDGMKDIGLDDNEPKRDDTPKAKKVEAPQAPKPQSTQAPEVKVDS